MCRYAKIEKYKKYEKPERKRKRKEKEKVKKAKLKNIQAEIDKLIVSYNKFGVGSARVFYEKLKNKRFKGYRKSKFCRAYGLFDHFKTEEKDKASEDTSEDSSEAKER